jgi:hypothetical protein
MWCILLRKNGDGVVVEVSLAKIIRDTMSICFILKMYTIYEIFMEKRIIILYAKK